MNKRSLGTFLALVSLSFAQNATPITASTPIEPEAPGAVTLAQATADQTRIVREARLAGSETRRLRVVLYIGFQPEDFTGPMPSFRLGADGPTVYFDGPSVLLPVPANPTADEYLVEVHHKPMVMPYAGLTLADQANAARALADRAAGSSDAAYFSGFADGLKSAAAKQR
jgi:hypothetical protein